MGTAFYIMAILGCGDSEIDCRELRVEPVRYVTADACSNATGDILVRHSDLSFPVLMAQCRPSGHVVAEGEKATPNG
jgi:hypothetical protein